MSSISSHFICLHDQDNVLVCIAPCAAGTEISIGAQRILLPNAIQVGHKIARKDIAVGDKIFKYGAPIGSAKADIGVGEHVHMHNIKSDYLPSHSRQGREGDESPL